MHLKQKGYCFGAFLIYTITSITLPSVGRCEPPASSHTNAHLAPRHDRHRGLTTTGLPRPANRQDRKRPYLHSRWGDVSRNPPYFHSLENKDGTRVERSGGRPEQTSGPVMASAPPKRSLKKTTQPEGEVVETSLYPPNEECGQGKTELVIHGKFYITGQFKAEAPGEAYQSDTAGSGQERTRGQRVRGSKESWQRLQPVVECGEDAMSLTVRRRQAVQLLLHPVNESPVGLSQLQPECGYSVQTTWKDLSLMARYDGCHVRQEDDSYVLPLLWRGIPVKMSCPASGILSQAEGPPSPPSVCCSPYGMTIKVQGLSAAEELRVNVRGDWTPVVLLTEQCGYTLERHDADIIIAAPFITCGISVKDEKYSLSLQIGEKTFALTCPVSPPEQLPASHSDPPVGSPPHLTTEPVKLVPETLAPFPWAPPFYLAPPYFPHPTYDHKYPGLNGQVSYNTPTPTSSTPDPAFGPQPLPQVASPADYQNYHSHQIPGMEYYKHFALHSSVSSTDDTENSRWEDSHLQQIEQTPVLGLSDKHSATHSPSLDSSSHVQGEAPPLETPSNAFSQYYHYYHHPKIPLPGRPQEPDPGPDNSSVPHTLNPAFPVLPRTVQKSEDLSKVDSDHILQPEPEDPSHPHTPYTTPPYPYHHFYFFPYIARGEAKRLSHLNPNTSSKTNLSDNQNAESNISVHPLPRSKGLRTESHLNPHTDQEKPDERISLEKNSPEWLKHPLLFDYDVKPELDDRGRPSAFHPVSNHSGPDTAVPPPEQPSFSTASPNHNVPPYPHYYPYQHVHQMFSGPKSLLHPVSPSSSEETLDPLLLAASSPQQHPSDPHPVTPLTKSMHDIHYDPLYPYYYHHIYHQPKVSADNQEVPPAGSANPEFQSPPSLDPANRQMDWLTQASAAGHPSIPQSSPLHSLYSHYITQQHPHDPFGHSDIEEAEERPDNDMEDRLKANRNTPSTLPGGLGSLSEFDCSSSSGCFSYAVKDSTAGQHFVFVVPDCVVEPIVAPPPHHSEANNVSCILQRLTSDSDVYTVPLEGCGVNKYLFSQTEVYLLEVHGILFLHQDHSPVRLMVECSSSPGSEGQVRLYMMDQPPPPPQSPPATVTVQLRIARDESFTSFYPDSHLPLGLILGRPVYLEVGLMDPPEPGLTLLVHSCLAYTQAPYASWMLIYDGCSSRGDSQRLPAQHSHHIRRIGISSFLSQPPETVPHIESRAYSHLDDSEIFFMCLTEVCFAADVDCNIGCVNSPNGNV